MKAGPSLTGSFASPLPKSPPRIPVRTLESFSSDLSPHGSLLAPTTGLEGIEFGSSLPHRSRTLRRFSAVGVFMEVPVAAA